LVRKDAGRHPNFNGGKEKEMSRVLSRARVWLVVPLLAGGLFAFQTQAGANNGHHGQQVQTKSQVACPPDVEEHSNVEQHSNVEDHSDVCDEGNHNDEGGGGQHQ
jgi:hypothetical protein